MVAGPVLVLVPFNILDTAPLLTATATTFVFDNPSASLPDYHSTHDEPTPVTTTPYNTVAPALLPTTTTVPSNLPTIFAPAPEPTITTTVPSNPPTPVVPEPDTTPTTRVYVNTFTQNAPVADLTPPPQNEPVPDPTPPPQYAPVPDTTPPPTNVASVSNTTSPTTSTPTLVADCNGVKWSLCLSVCRPGLRVP